MKHVIPYQVRVELRRAARWLRDSPGRRQFARTRASDTSVYPHLLMAHSAKLLRKLNPELMPLQINKVQNLKLACDRLDKLLVAPGQQFSFCALVGRTSRHRGYLDGLEMHNGELVGAPGGGLCQLSNLLYWMTLHLNVEISERHRHGFDLFTDDARTVPFGMGATVFHNYLDFRFRNSLGQALLLRAWVEDDFLRGAFLSDRELPFRVEIAETAHRFFRDAAGAVWRENRVERRVVFCDGSNDLQGEIAHNLAQVRYEVPDSLIEQNS